ncbi:MAG: hypothetical protein AcusKO_36360 [Acuticoccus sp.]
MTHTDPEPRGVLVIDGDKLSLAHDAETGETATPADVVGGRIVPAALLVRTLEVPRRQRTGAQQIAPLALADIPFYAFCEGIDEDALPTLAAAASPFDRLLVRAACEALPRLPRLAVSGDDVPALLATVFDDLAGAGPDGAARHAAKWAFGDIKRELTARLSRLAQGAARNNRPLRLAHMRCGDAAMALAVDDAITYLGVDDRAGVRATNPAALAPEALTRDATGEIGVFLLSDFGGPDAGVADVAALRPLAALAARQAVVIAILPHEAGDTQRGLTNEARVARLAALLGTAFGGTCRTRLLSSLAHKPSDTVPATVVAEFEVSR